MADIRFTRRALRDIGFRIAGLGSVEIQYVRHRREAYRK